MYSAAFDEFRRAIAIESRDRAEVLAALWDHFFALVQVLPSLLSAAQISTRFMLFCEVAGMSTAGTETSRAPRMAPAMEHACTGDTITTCTHRCTHRCKPSWVS